MKKIFVCCLVLLNLSLYASEITLNHRILNNCDNDSCYYDFFNMTQKYGYGLSLEFGNDWGKNKFGTVQVVDELGLIVDLGKMSCENLTSDGSYDRKENPWGWLYRSNNWDRLQRGEGQEEVPAIEGHCYLMYKTSSDQLIAVAFHVKEHIKDIKVVLDEVEIFKRATIKE